jgi:hypothetical protein
MESTLIQKIHEAGSGFRFTEEDLFDQVAREVAKNARKDGLWTKALSESGMNEERAKALYIKLRVEQLHDEAYQLIEKLKIQEHQELLRLLDEAKEDRKIAAEEMSKAMQLKIESDELKSQNAIEILLKLEDFEKKKNTLKSKLEISESKNHSLEREYKALMETLRKTQSSLFNARTIVVLLVIFIVSYFAFRT